MTIRLLLADDHDLLRLGFQALLASHDDLEIVAEAANGEQAYEAVAVCNPDLVVLDVRMAHGDGLNCLGRLKLEYPDLPVLMISSYDNPTYVARAVALGAVRIPAEKEYWRRTGGGNSYGGRRRVGLETRGPEADDRCPGHPAAQCRRGSPPDAARERGPAADGPWADEQGDCPGAGDQLRDSQGTCAACA